MTSLILIPAAQTDWQAQGRFAGDIDVPLNEAGRSQAITAARAIASFAPSALFSGPEQATKQTGSLIAHELALRLRTAKKLRELNLGHWEGLTVSDFKERFPKVYKQWRANPLTVEPPEGESISAAAERLLKHVRSLAGKHEGGTIALVLGQFAGAILTCVIADSSYDRFWEYIDEPAPWRRVELLPESPGAQPASPA